jgi:hypothetical protein
MRRFAIAPMLFVIATALAPTAAASSPVAVDPSSLIPPPNPNFDWTCTSNGQRIDCWGVEYFESDGLEGGDPAFSCDGRQIQIAFTQTVTAHRTHDASGRVLRNHQVGTFDERWTLEGSEGAGLTSRGRWVVDVVYAIPGEPESRTNAYTGMQLAVSAPGVGVIFQNNGRVLTNWDESEVLAISGQQSFYEDFDGAIAAACDVLLAQG